MGYRFDAADFRADTIMYTNAAGYTISISKLQFYLSNIKLIKNDGSFYAMDQVLYFDAKKTSFSSALLADIPAGNYSGISFLIGLDSLKNKQYGLPSTVENNNMEWPMGGYHFLKMEGYFLDSAKTYGYAMHLGENGNAVSVTLTNRPFVIGAETTTLALKMNINEWYKNPAIYNFRIDGDYSMNSQAAMAKLKSNGSDIFNQ